ncbi:hypothetical protein Vadar_001247 [Vaccinium darrowii]|uniref:Uncharacterized protein n=1 Tax=Vaccinium darrowii TaxID=229202 RepID=A0ACB7WX75_9ERIC|nr:hypothetical protein Vadar_001247 [Vaccinium darrowii]
MRLPFLVGQGQELELPRLEKGCQRMSKQRILLLLAGTFEKARKLILPRKVLDQNFSNSASSILVCFFLISHRWKGRLVIVEDGKLLYKQSGEFLDTTGEPRPFGIIATSFQPGTSFGAIPMGSVQPGSGLSGASLGSGFLPRNIDIKIRTGRLIPTPNAAGGLQSSTRDPQVRVVPIRTVVAAVPATARRSSSDSSHGSVGFLYPVIARVQRVGQQQYADYAAPQRDIVIPGVDANTPGGATQNGQGRSVQISSGLDQLLRSIFPGVDNIYYQGTNASSAAGNVGPGQGTTTTTQEAAPGVAKIWIRRDQLLQLKLRRIQTGGPRQIGVVAHHPRAPNVKGLKVERLQKGAANSRITLQEDIRNQNYIDNSIKHGIHLSAFRKERIWGDSYGISYCGKQLRPTGKAPNGDTRVQFQSDQIRLLVSHETQLPIYDASKMDRIHQWVPQDVLPAPISYAAYSCNSQLVYASFCDALLSGSQAVYPLVIAAHPQEPNQFAVGLTDGSVKDGVVFKHKQHTRSVCTPRFRLIMVIKSLLWQIWLLKELALLQRQDNSCEKHCSSKERYFLQKKCCWVFIGGTRPQAVPLS